MNVNVSYNGFSLADAASCVMMRLPVSDLVWDMEALWKVWNEPLPAVDVPEVLPEPLPEVPAVKSKKPVGCHRAITYAGKEYPDVKSLAEAYHLNYKTCFARLRDGLPLDAPINRHPLPYRGKPVTIGGKEYPSVKDASKALGIPYTTLFTRIRKGQDLSAPKYADRCEPITYQGKEYPSVEALSRATGINSRSWLYRIRHNIPLDAPWGKGGRKQKAVTEPVPEAPAAPAPKSAVKPITINGKEYQSFHEAEEAERKSREVEKPEPKRSPLDTLMTSGLTKPKPVVYDGKEYPSMEALAREYNRHISYCYNHIRKGLPIVKKEERQEPDDVDERSLREIRATPADETKAWQKKWKACRYGGKKYTSLNALADIAEVSLGQAYKGVQKMGKWIREDEI